jgi:cytosine/adenosine deaminase-related metal-dependent hydrolase
VPAGEGPTTLIRARVLHTPRDPFAGDGSALECYENGAVAFADGQIVATGDFAEVAARHPDAELIDERDAFLLPGLVDTHVHWPQLGAVGAMGLELLDWLRTRTLPEEAKLADLDYARPLARDFVRALAANGTTTALVFGTHFRQAATCSRRFGRHPTRPTRRPPRWAAAGTGAAASDTRSRRASRSPAPRRCSSPAAPWPRSWTACS